MLNRKIQEHDFEGIHKLVCQVHELHVANRPDIYNDIDAFDREYFDFLRKDPNTISLVTELEDKIVGFCIVTLRQPSKNPLLKARKVAYMEDLCVDKRHRNLGIGRTLFNEVKLTAKEKGYDVMELMVWSFNDTAIKFYESMGMKPRSMFMEQKL